MESFLALARVLAFTCGVWLLASACSEKVQPGQI